MATVIARFRELAQRLAGTFRPRRSDKDIEEELRSHLEMASAALGNADTPDPASRDAVLRHGALAQAIEAVRDQRGLPWFEDLARDVRHVARQLGRDPGFTIATVLSLALGIGATTAAFSAINGLLLRRLPIANPDSLVAFMWDRSGRGGGGGDDVDAATGERLFASFSRTSFDLFSAHTDGLADVFAVAPLWRMNLVINRQPELGDGVVVSGNYYNVLGLVPLRGRLLVPADDEPGAAPVAVISERYWRTRFASDPSVVGRTLAVNGTVVTVVGVAPAGFEGVLLSYGAQDIALPLVLAPEVAVVNYGRYNPNRPWLHVLGRLRHSAAVARLRDRLDGAFQANAREDDLVPASQTVHLHVAPAPYGRTGVERRQAAKVLLPILGLAAVLLAVAALNVANLFLARATARAREMAMRLALGATRGRIVRLLLAEAVELAVAGALFGAVAAGWGLRALQMTFDPADRPMFDYFLTLNVPVLSFTLAVALVTAVLFALAPVWRARRLDPKSAFLSTSRWVGGDSVRLRRALIVGQVALSSILLIVAGLCLQTLRNVQAVDVGFTTERLLLFRVDSTNMGYAPADSMGLNTRLANAIAGVAGVRSVTFSNWPLGSGWSGNIQSFDVPGHPPIQGDDGAALIGVGPNYFETLEIPMLAGRSFTDGDQSSTTTLAIVNDTMRRQYFDGADPLGRQIRVGKDVLSIIGVARDVRQTDSRSPVLSTVFVPFARSPEPAHFSVRTIGDPTPLMRPIRQAAASVDERLPLDRLHTQADELAWRQAAERFYVKGSMFLGLAALALVSVGLFGLMSYLVNRRRGEIGLRMALGALPGQVLWPVLRDGLVLVAMGVAVGIAGAIPTSKLIANALYGVSPTDPRIYTSMAILLGVVAAFASLLPARRAARTDPAEVLRQE